MYRFEDYRWKLQLSVNGNIFIKRSYQFTLSFFFFTMSMFSYINVYFVFNSMFDSDNYKIS